MQMIADRNKIQSFFRELNSASIEQFLTTSIDEKSREEFKVDNPIYRINILYQNSKSNFLLSFQNARYRGDVA